MSKIKINGKYYKDLSKLNLYGEETKTRETANSYVISEPGDYCFPLVYGNSITDGKVNKASYTNLGGTYQADFVNADNNPIRSPFIEEDLGRDAASLDLLISDEEETLDDLGINKPSGERCRFAYFTVLNVPETGANVVVGLVDGNDDIVWSWHLWLWKKDLTPVTIKNHTGYEYEILPVNLGSKYDEDGIHMKNWFYQWGRKDPMLCSENYNSNTVITSYGSTSFSISNAASSVDQAIKNPCTFYKTGGSTYKYNWVQLNYFYNFWDASCGSTGFTEKTITKTVYDPCPPGYSIPNARVFTFTSLTGSYIERSGYDETADTHYWLPSDGLNGLIQPWQNGYNFYTASGDTVFFPASGYRNDDSDGVNSMGSSGNYWSAGAYEEGSATLLNFDSCDIYPMGSTSRAYGYSVRPCKIKTSLPKTEGGKHIIHQHSSESGKTPYPVQLAPGEISVNNAAGNEFLAIRGSNDEIVRFISESRIYELLDKPKDLSKMDIHGTIKDTRETANSYVISKPGEYCFPLVYGNAIKDGVTNTGSYTNEGGTYQAAFVNYSGNQITSPFIETDTGTTAASVEVLIADEDNVVSNLSLVSSSDPCKFVKFKVTRIPTTGANLVIGVKDSSSNVMWSWHIWLWDAERFSLLPVTITNYEGNNYNIMPYNLGTKLDSDLTHMKNWFYQWGRKDPMLCSEAYNSNTVITSYGSTSFSINNGPASNVSNAIKNPCTFYTYGGNNTYHYNWTQSPGNFFNFWDASCGSAGYTEKTVVKTIYDPCPPGYSSPNARVFTGFVEDGEYAECSDWADNDNGIWLPGDGLNGLIQPWQNGYNFYTVSGDTVFFPASGYRSSNNGGVGSMGNGGYCWSAGAGNENSATLLYFDSGYVGPLDSGNRAYGFSVRPCAY